MAESLPERGLGDVFSNVQTENWGNLECAVCLQNCVHPAQLPCGHVFCYLCIKGIVNRNRRCAMCRQSIPADFLEKPRLLRPVENDSESKGFDDGHSWFYEGHNGWWQYDERTSSELETAYQSGERCCEILVAGYLYVADFDSMLQYRRNDTCKRRRIKRDLTTTNKKGVAGLKLSKDTTTPSNSSNIVSNVLIPGMQNLHISNRSDSLSQRTSLARLRTLAREPLHVETDTHFNRGHSLSPLLPAYPRDARANQSESEIDNVDALYTRNSELDGMIHSSLDWTIQQIESLRAELSSDEDNLTEDVNHYQVLNNVFRLRAAARNEIRIPQDPLPILERNLENERAARGIALARAQANFASGGGNGFERHDHDSHEDEHGD